MLCCGPGRESRQVSAVTPNASRGWVLLETLIAWEASFSPKYNRIYILFWGCFAWGCWPDDELPPRARRHASQPGSLQTLRWISPFCSALYCNLYPRKVWVLALQGSEKETKPLPPSLRGIFWASSSWILMMCQHTSISPSPTAALTNWWQTDGIYFSLFTPVHLKSVTLHTFHQCFNELLGKRKGTFFLEPFFSVKNITIWRKKTFS